MEGNRNYHVMTLYHLAHFTTACLSLSGASVDTDWIDCGLYQSLFHAGGLKCSNEIIELIARWTKSVHADDIKFHFRKINKLYYYLKCIVEWASFFVNKILYCFLNEMLIQRVKALAHYIIQNNCILHCKAYLLNEILWLIYSPDP